MPPRLNCEPPPAFHYYADPDPATTLLRFQIRLFTVMRIPDPATTLMRFRIRLFTLIWIPRTTVAQDIYTESTILKVPLPVTPAKVIRFHTLPDAVAL